MSYELHLVLYDKAKQALADVNISSPATGCTEWFLDGITFRNCYDFSFPVNHTGEYHSAAIYVMYTETQDISMLGDCEIVLDNRDLTRGHNITIKAAQLDLSMPSERQLNG